MQIRPASMEGRGGEPTKPIPTTVRVRAPHGRDPGKTATFVDFSFRLTERAKVDRAVAAFIEVLEADE